MNAPLRMVLSIKLRPRGFILPFSFAVLSDLSIYLSVYSEREKERKDRCYLLYTRFFVLVPSPFYDRCFCTWNSYWGRNLDSAVRHLSSWSETRTKTPQKDALFYNPSSVHLHMKWNVQLFICSKKKPEVISQN